MLRVGIWTTGATSRKHAEILIPMGLRIVNHTKLMKKPEICKKAEKCVEMYDVEPHS